MTPSNTAHTSVVRLLFVATAAAVLIAVSLPFALAFIISAIIKSALGWIILRLAALLDRLKISLGGVGIVGAIKLRRRRRK